MSWLMPCPGCGRNRKADEGHHLCRECEGYPPDAARAVQMAPLPELVAALVEAHGRDTVLEAMGGVECHLIGCVIHHGPMYRFPEGVSDDD